MRSIRGRVEKNALIMFAAISGRTVAVRRQK
jgi:hypothetical protein